MFERFTDRARRVVVLAQDEAMLLNHNYIGTEHLLLGLLHEGDGVAFQALTPLGVNLDGFREAVADMIGHGTHQPTGHIPFTPRGRKVLELALREALQLGHNYIGTEHLLLGIVREGDGIAMQILGKLGVSHLVRSAVIQQMQEPTVALSDRSPAYFNGKSGTIRVLSVPVERFELDAETDDELRAQMAEHNAALDRVIESGERIRQLAEAKER